MNIYVVTPWYPSNKNDTRGSFVREQVIALNNRGHKIVVFRFSIFSLRELKEYKNSKEYVWNDDGVVTRFVNVLSVVPQRFEKIYHKHVSYKFYKILKKHFKKDKNNGFYPNIIHAHVGPWCAYFTIPAAKKTKLPIVVTEHYSGLADGTIKDLKFVREEYVVQNANATMLVGTNLKSKIFKVTGHKDNMYVIPNLIRADNHLISKEQHASFSFLTACYLVKRKHVEHVINAFHQEFSDDKNVKLKIAGDGERRDYLSSLIKELHEEDRIEMTGAYSRDQVVDIFSSCDAFVLTSEFETFGIVYIEAMMCGLPCIGTKGQGSDDIINKDNGISVGFGDIDELRKAMRYIHTNIDKYDKQAIQDYVIKNFSPDAVCEQIEEVYNKVLSKYEK